MKLKIRQIIQRLGENENEREWYVTGQHLIRTLININGVEHEICPLTAYVFDHHNLFVESEQVEEFAITWLGLDTDDANTFVNSSDCSVKELKEYDSSVNPRDKQIKIRKKLEKALNVIS